MLGKHNCAESSLTELLDNSVRVDSLFEEALGGEDQLEPVLLGLEALEVDASLLGGRSDQLQLPLVSLLGASDALDLVECVREDWLVRALGALANDCLTSDVDLVFLEQAAAGLDVAD